MIECCCGGDSCIWLMAKQKNDECWLKESKEIKINKRIILRTVLVQSVIEKCSETS